ncbi:anhydro-N-acetylmuramic acid kinase [Pedobacter boryungensis]|uniref:Anhydro-N-acetylmuramic acid kinase n=1 Tax=Pedobacter boryungensis TaxID=869962 RepID=A0ABX2DFK4_9SPHI|nr:anhydro-N-acetylmuramic acid kinase [Pedobacter boryungensis]NQX32883.1 anhydro-N-acetylmuramic acid kinase [Pedobacter boryungensis]
MNINIKKLYSIADKKERLIIGLMSGTSMDGLDIALCLCKDSGSKTEVKLLNFITMPYQDDFRADVKSIFSRRDADLEKVCLLNELIGLKHAELILSALTKWNINPANIDVIASHGQTIFHAPKSLHGKKNYPNATLQIGDGDHIAVATGIITIADFRQKHLAAGGEGAPLAVYGDYLVFSKKDEDRIMLNIGGIANFTFLPGDKDATKVFSTDVGPGNTLMDQFVQLHYPGIYYDKNAEKASAGKVNLSLLKELLENNFFEIGFPKTTGPELFNLAYLQRAQVNSNTTNISNEDVLATLCHFSANAIIDAIEKTTASTKLPKIFMSGGGMHNPLLVKLLKNALPKAIFSTTDELEINPDAKEAVLFALLANETLAGSPINFGEREGVPSVCMGKISLPN